MNVKELKLYLDKLPEKSTVEVYKTGEDGYGYYDELTYSELRIDDGKSQPERSQSDDLPF